MKECKRCHVINEDSEFAFRNKAKGTLQPYCKEYKREIDKELYDSKLLKSRNSQRVRL